MDESRRSSGESYYSQVSDSIRNVFELSTRIDERVQIMMKKQEELERKMDVQLISLQAVSQRVAVLESQTNDIKDDDDIEVLKKTVHDLEMKVSHLESDNSKNTDRWKGIVGFIIQIVWCIIAGYILYKLGLQAPVGP